MQVVAADVRAVREKDVMRVQPVAVRPHDRRVGAAEQIAADVGQRRRIDTEQRQQRRREIGLTGWQVPCAAQACLAVPRRCPGRP